MNIKLSLAEVSKSLVVSEGTCRCIREWGVWKLHSTYAYQLDKFNVYSVGVYSNTSYTIYDRFTTDQYNSLFVDVENHRDSQIESLIK